MDKSIPQNWKEITRDSYDQYAQDFALYAGILRGKKKEWIDRFVALLKKGSVLDVGCGAGGDAMYLSQNGFDVTGIDFSSKLIEITKEKVPSGKFLVMDFEELDFPKDSFDGVWAMASLLHVPKQNLPSVLQKIHKVLKPGGLFFASFRVGDEAKITIEQRGNAHLKRFYEYFQPAVLQGMLKETGFKNIEQDLDQIISGDWVAFFSRK